MARAQPIRTRPGRKQGELTVAIPPGWELRLRRVLKQTQIDALPDPRERGLTPGQRATRIAARRTQMQRAICQYLTDLLTADLVGKEIALATRSRYGTRRGSLREQVMALMRDAADA